MKTTVNLSACNKSIIKTFYIDPKDHSSVGMWTRRCWCGAQESGANFWRRLRTCASSSSFRVRTILMRFLEDGTLCSLPFPSDLQDHPQGLSSQHCLSPGASSVTQSWVALQKCRKLCYGFLCRLLICEFTWVHRVSIFPRFTICFVSKVSSVWLHPPDGHTLFCKWKSGPSFLLLSPHLFILGLPRQLDVALLHCMRNLYLLPIEVKPFCLMSCLLLVSYTFLMCVCVCVCV